MRTVVDSIIAAAGGEGCLTVLDSGAEPVETLSWAALHERARQMAAVLRERGIGPGSRIGLLADSTVDTVAAIQAVWLAGAAVSVLAPPKRGMFEQLVADARFHLVVAQDPVSLTGSAQGWGLPEWRRRADSATAIALTPPDPADLAILQYTSGSTRRPHGVPITHAHLAANLTAMRAGIQHDALHPARAMCWLPLYHDMGLIGFVAKLMACGCSLYLQSPAAFARRPASWLHAISRHRIAMSGGPNLAYVLLTGLLAAEPGIDLSTVRFLLTGAEPIDAALMAEFARLGRLRGLDPSALVAGYGLAESTLAVTFSPVGAGIQIDRPSGDVSRRPLVRCGFPVPGTTIRIVDQRTGRPAEPGTPGHIEICGPSVVGHYWGQSPPEPGAWFRTGDIGYLTPGEGELVVCGRVKDVLFAAGRNVYPQDVEAAAAGVPGVRPGGVAAFGIPGERADRLVVAVEFRGLNPVTVQQGVRLAVREEVGLTPAQVVMLPIGRLPRTSSGKIRRSEIRRRFLSGGLNPTEGGWSK